MTTERPNGGSPGGSPGGSSGANRDAHNRDEAVRAKRLRDQALSEEVRPFLLQQFRDRVEPAAAGAAVAARFPIDQHQAYRWTAIIYDELERARRRIARIFATVMWLGAAVLAVLVVGAITGRVVDTTPSVVIRLVFGVVLLASGIAGGLNARRFIALR